MYSRSHGLDPFSSLYGLDSSFGFTSSVFQILNVLGFVQVVASVSNVHAKDSDSQPGGVDDMTKLAYLHEPGVLYNLASRYELDEIYVSISSQVVFQDIK